MPLPISRSALDKLGDRLVAAETISDDDQQLLLDVLTAYGEALAVVRDHLTALGYTATTRVKTTGVLVDKLRREQSMKLKGVQDVAGARIVVDGGRVEQDEVVEQVVATFRDGARPPSVRDRREVPSSGYRAVHVVVFEDGVPVEVQVRTRLQDLWAQVVEQLGDIWGRGIRYGEQPPDPGARVPEPFGTRERLWKDVLLLSEEIDVVEGWRALSNLADVLLELKARLLTTEDEHDLYETERQEREDSKARLADAEDELTDSLTALLDLVARVQ